MNLATKRILSALLLFLIFTLAVYLRFYGLDWSYKDGVGTYHPDERHYENCASELHPYWLTEAEKQLPLWQQAQILYAKNLQVQGERGVKGNPALRPINYNYGTLPLFLYMGYQSYLGQHAGSGKEWILFSFPDWLSILAIVIAFFIGFRLYYKIGKDLHISRGRVIPWYKDATRLSYFMPSFLLPLAGLAMAVVLPVTLVDFTKYTVSNSGTILIIGRILTAWAGAFTVVIAYLIGRDAYNQKTGLIAAMMLATAMLHVQTSHFATVDVLLGFWLTAGVYCFLKVSQKPRLYWYLLGAVCTGFAIGTKWSGILLPGILFLAHAATVWKEERTGRAGRYIQAVWLILTALITLHFYKSAKSNNPTFDVTLTAFRDFYIGNYHWIGFLVLGFILFVGSLYVLHLRNVWHANTKGFFKPAFLVYRPWAYLLIAIITGFAALMVAEPMAYFDAKSFAEDMARESMYHSTGETPVVYTQQYNHTPSFFYTLDNLFYPSLDYLTAFFVVAGCLYALWRLLFRRNASDLILAAWVIPSFVLFSMFHSKFPRYLDAILPVMMVLGGKLIADLASIQPSFYSPQFPNVSYAWKRFFKYSGLVGGGLAMVCGLIYGWSYIKIYDSPHTLVQTKDYLKQQMQSRKTITMQSWDEGIPEIHIEYKNTIGIHDRPDEDKNPKVRIAYLADILSKNDYIVLQSKRGYGTTLRNPEKFPVTNKFLRAFFAEQLGFRVAKVVNTSPTFLGWEFDADQEDETAAIYDHPKVIVFEKIKVIPPAQLQDLMLNPPSWVNQITDKELLSIRDGAPVYAQNPSHPLFRWILLIQLLGWMAFIGLFPLCKALPDRGYGISKIIGIAIFSWSCWILASIHAVPFSRTQAFFVFLTLFGVSWFLMMKQWESLGAYLKEKWLALTGMEILYFVLLAIFLMIRTYHPNAIWGEKPMNISFINAVYRASYFPPEDPWISGFPINYYYYGHAVYSIIGKFAGIPPEYLFNIGGASVTALTGLAIFSLAFALCRKAFISLIAVYLAVFAGPLVSLLNIIKHENQLNGISFGDFAAGIFSAGKFMCIIILYYLGIDLGLTEKLKLHSYDLLFWQSGHNIFKGTAANEFPYWTHLFMDFHAHMLVMPFTFAFLVLLYAYFARPRKETNGWEISGFVVVLALLLGTVTCTNTWDLPGLIIGLGFIVAVKFFRESVLIGKQPVYTDWLSPQTWQEIFRFPVAPLLSILILSVLMLYPFHFWFDSRVNSIGIMTEGNSPLTTYLSFFVHLLIPLIIAGVFLAVIRRDGRISAKRCLAFSVFFSSIFIFFQVYTRWNPFHFPSPHTFGAIELGLPMDYTVVGLFLPFLFVMFFSLWQRWRSSETVFWLLLGVLGLGLSMGIEFFYIKEGWSEPSHRWNTIFKFNLQVWHYLSIFAAISLLYCWRAVKPVGVRINSAFVVLSRTGLVSLIVLFWLVTLPFAVIGPILVTKTVGAIDRDGKGVQPSLDGLAWLQKEAYSAYAGIQWFNRFVPGSPAIVELFDNDHAYQSMSRFCSNTGLPGILGWPNHIRERKHSPEVDIRNGDIQKIYTSNDRKEVYSLLGQYNVEYLVFSDLEMSMKRGMNDRLAPYGAASLKRFEDWGDLFTLVYRYGNTSIFQINRSMNTSFVYQPPKETQLLPPAKQKEDGSNMFQTGVGSGNGEFNEPRGIIETPNGQFVVVDTKNHRIQAFKPTGEFIWKMGAEGDQDGQFKEPNDAAIDPTNGHIYITDTWNHRVVRLTPEGVFVGAAQYEFFGPRGIAFHPTKKLLYIADTGHSQIKVISLDGTPVQTWGKLGQEDADFREPVGIDVMPNGNVAIVDSLNKRVKIYTAEGELVRHWPIQTSWNGQSGFESHLASLPDGNLYLTDPKESSVHIYTEQGQLVGKIKTGVDGVPLQQPLGITVTRQGQVLVTDYAQGRVIRIK